MHILAVGATQGTGQLIAERLHARGDRLTIIARSPQKVTLPAETIRADLIDPASLPADFSPYDALVLTAGVTKRPAGEALVKATEYDGTRHLLDAAAKGGFTGRLLYMNSIGVTHNTLMSALLNLAKGRTMHWRQQTEAAIRAAGVPHTILRAGLLNNRPAGTHTLRVVEEDIPLKLGTQVSRADMADLFVAALDTEASINRCYSVIWEESGPRQDLRALLR
ncbi:MAG: NAD(P)H-binding protein [Chloroflexi bacterium]|nr:NAD(P)H-binding protein [Chloroflexota bacterium]